MTLENQLRAIHDRYYRGAKEDLPDVFDNWLSELTIEDIHRFVEEGL